MLPYINLVTILLSILLTLCQAGRITQTRQKKTTFQEDYTHIKVLNSYYKYHTIANNWDDAIKICAKEGAYLFYPENKNEADAVISFWRQRSNEISPVKWAEINWMYVGISDIAKHGAYVTIHGQPISTVYVNWLPGQPSGGTEHCIQMSKLGFFNDNKCWTHGQFICKIRSITTTTRKPTTTTTTRKPTTTTTTHKPTTTTTTRKPTTTTTTHKPTTTTTTRKPTTTTTTRKPTTTTTTAKPTTTTKRTTPSSTSCNIQTNNSNVTLKTFVFWPNGTVPFYINPDHFDDEQATVILKSLSMFADNTCIKFAPVMVAPDEGQHVMTFINPEGVMRCKIETKGHLNYNPHLVLLGYNCLNTRDLDMIIMRALGLPFEHNRACRDVYIDVWTENIEPSYIQLFTKDNILPKELQNIPYDYFSIMHFGERYYSKNGHRTIRFKIPSMFQARNGHTKTGLTPSDIKKIALIYGPECRTRDRAEKIAICRTYPGVSRRKREIIEPPANMSRVKPNGECQNEN